MLPDPSPCLRWPAALRWVSLAFAACVVSGIGAVTAAAHEAEEDALIDPALEPPTEHTPDWQETPAAAPSVQAPEPPAKAFGAVSTSLNQPLGALTGKIVYMNCGHGWIWAPDYWRLQRPVVNEMNEDYGNLDQLNLFAAYCFNAGATVVSMRPLGRQTNEVVLDNDDPGVTWAGTWFDSTSTYFFGTAGDVPYRYAALDAAETATATYTPSILQAGLYPVYTWVRAGSDRGRQLYRIRHTGGESLVRIPHHMAGNGWIWLGEYHFDAGSNAATGSVVVSNLRSDATGTYAFADAIRFGNGMGTVDRGSGVSGYPREEESCRYWIQSNLGQGQSATLYDGGGNDESDSWSAPPKMSAEMNREAAGAMTDRIHVSFHTNAGGGRGTVGLITGTPTTNQAALAQILGSTVNSELVGLGSPPLEVPWFNRSNVTYTGGYSELDGSLFGYEMDAGLIEVAFHDSADDAKLLRDPKARTAVARAAMHGVVKYMNQFAGTALNYLPEPPTGLRARAGQDGTVTLEWEAPVSSANSGAPAGYVVQRSANGLGFGAPIALGNVTRHVLTGVAPGTETYFRVTAYNAGGESFPSETAGCRTPDFPQAPRVLVVNAFDRNDRTLNLRQDVARQSWAPPDGTGAIERVIPSRSNSFAYVVPHGRALAAAGAAFDSCQNEAVATGQIFLGEYAVVVWACGQESTADETFSPAEQAKIAAFRADGGHLFASGSDIGWDLGRASGPTAADRAFLSAELKVGLPSDAADNSGTHTLAAVAGGLFAGRASMTIDDGTRGIYPVRAPDVLTPSGPGARAALAWPGASTGAAAIQYDGSAGGGRVVTCGFPFESIASSSQRADWMTAVLDFLTAPDVLVPAGATWRYEATGTDLGTAWAGEFHDDSAWPQGPAQLGYGEGDEMTTLPADPTRTTTYFRREFTVADPGKFGALRLRLLRDDGAAVWLNGREVVRSNLPATGPITWSTSALTAVGGADESTFFTSILAPQDLRTGRNVIAVELHQSGTASSDLSFDLELAGLASTGGTLVTSSAVWRYRDSGVAPAATWRELAFDDSTWPSGPARLGYGGDGEATIVSNGGNPADVHRTTWFRHTFTVPDAAAIQALRVDLQRDDGAIVSLNGRELLRSNLPATGVGPTTFATTSVGGADETAWFTHVVPAGALVTGENVLAVEVHQAAANSSDLGFALHLAGLAHPSGDALAWLAARFGSDAGSPAASLTADADADGASNMLEWATGTDPLDPSAAPAAGVSTEAGGGFVFHFVRHSLATDVTFTVQATDDLAGPWTDLARSTNGDACTPLVAGVTVTEGPTGALRTVEVRDARPTAAGQRFFRLSVVR